MDYVLAFFILAVLALVCWLIIQLWDKRPENRFWDVIDFAGYAVRAARELTGSKTNADIGVKAEALLRAKFPKLPATDIEVAIGQALDKLEGKAAQATPTTSPTVDSPDILE